MASHLVTSHILQDAAWREKRSFTATCHIEASLLSEKVLFEKDSFKLFLKAHSEELVDISV